MMFNLDPPKLRKTKGPPIVTRAKLAVLRDVQRGHAVPIRFSWVTRVLIADGLLQERPNDLFVKTGARSDGYAELTMLGVLALDRGTVGPIQI